MEIKILGTGCCSKCAALYSAAEKAVAELGIDASLEKITDIEQILSYDVMRTPAIVIDGRVQSAGRVLNIEEVKKLLTAVR